MVRPLQLRLIKQGIRVVNGCNLELSGIAMLLVASGTCIALAIAVEDLRRLRVPNLLNAALALSGVVWAAGFCDRILALVLVEAALAGTVFYVVRAVYLHVRGVEGLGMGDVKLASSISIWSGLMTLPVIVLLACLLALVHIVLNLMFKRTGITRDTRLPFGTYLCVAFVIQLATIASATTLT